MPLTKSDFDKICRICLEQKNTLTSILTTDILNMFHTCTTIKIENNDKLPSNICSYCLNKLHNLFLFNQQCEKSNQTLRQLLEWDSELLFDQQCENSNYKLRQLFNYNDESWFSLESETEAEPNKLPEPKKVSNENPILYSLLYGSDENKSIDIKSEPDSNVNQKFKLELDDWNSPFHVRSFYTCELCLERCLSVTELAEHTQTEHESTHQTNGKLKCQQCSQYFATELLLNWHTTCVHEKTYNSVLCSVCGAKTSSSNEMKIHMKIHNGENQEFCDISKAVIDTHVKDDIKAISCTECNKTFTLEMELDIHMQYVHEQYTCTDCNKTFSKAFNLKKHRIVHTEDRPFFCVKCHKTFKYADVLKKHELRVHSERTRQKCDICEKEVLDLKAHREISHSAEKPFQCEKCSKYFVTELALKYHIRNTHDRLYSRKTALCNVCGFVCDHKYALQQHMRVHTGEKPYKCDLCDKTFRFKHSLVSHKMSHTDERAFNCKICDKSFKLRKSLKRHMFIHTGQRPYICNICSKAFNESSILKRHMRVHSIFEKSK